MADFNTDMNIQMQNIDSIKLIHEASSTEFYIGTSRSGGDINSTIWQIKKISKTANVWNVTQFPNGDQGFKFIWNNRLSYTYV